MGSFNVTCTGSNLSIGYGDSVKMFILVPRDKWEEYNRTLKDEVVFPKHGKLIPEPFRLFCLPISGSYDSYGRIENIVESVTTREIEKFFGIPIDSFVDKLTCGRTNGFSSEDEYSKFPNGMKNHEIAKTLHCCFMLSSIFQHLEEMSSTTVLEGPINDTVLECLGFQRNELSTEKLSYLCGRVYRTEDIHQDTYDYHLKKVKYFYTHPKLNDIDLFDHTLISKNDADCQNYIFSVKSLDTAIYRLAKLKLVDILSNPSYLKEDSKVREILKRVQEVKDMELFLPSDIKHVTFGILEDYGIYDSVSIVENIDKFHQISRVLMSLLSCDRHLMPMPHGTQQGDDEMQYRLTKKIEAILVDRIINREEDDEEDDEE